MSKLFDDASLAMIPSAYKDGKLYSIRPTDGSGDFTFSRGSNLAATRVDVNGLIEKGRENLFLQSNQFDTTWVNSNTTDTGGQAGYDGSNDAWLLTKNAVASAYIAQTKSTSGVSTASVYVKAGTIDVITLWCNQVGGGNPFGTFNLSTLTLVDSGTIVDSNITSVGNDWYRVSITFSVSTTLFRIYVDNFSNTTAGNIYIQDAQLEAGLVATDYIETGASTAQAGILEDMPRLDYSGGASCPSLLLEPQRTNQLIHSEYLSGWSAYTPSSTISINSAISPEGVQNACEITFTGSGNDFAYENLYYATTAPSVFSVYLRVASGTKVVALRTAIANEYKAVTITTEWQRFELNITSAQAQERVGIDNRATYGASGTAGTIEVYGAQLESGSYPTSYIPTYGSSVTRSDEFFYNYDNLQDLGILGSTWTFLYDQTYVDELRDAACAVFLLDNGNDGDGSISVRVALNTNGSFRLQDSDGIQYSSTANKILCRYDGSKISWYGDGSLINEHNVTGAYNTLDRHNPSGSNKKQIKLNQVLIFPTALTDSECIALTTL